jgi:hypothetical protein
MSYQFSVLRFDGCLEVLVGLLIFDGRSLTLEAPWKERDAKD